MAPIAHHQITNPQQKDRLSSLVRTVEPSEAAHIVVLCVTRETRGELLAACPESDPGVADELAVNVGTPKSPSVLPLMPRSGFVDDPQELL